MDGRIKAVIAVVILVSLFSQALVMFLPMGDTGVAKDQPVVGPSDDPVGPVVPDPEPEPEPVQYPEGIRYDANSRTLTSERDSQWSVTDELKAHLDRTVERHHGRSLALDPGYYSVTVDGESFRIVVAGTETRTVSWEYYMGGQVHEVSVSYDIDIAELAGVTESSRELNSDMFLKFDELPSLVCVNDTTRSIVSQMTSEYVRIGGSTDDCQSYADFIASFAQAGIGYPSRPYVWTDGDGNAVLVDGIPKRSTDYEVWGCEEYWAHTLETLHHGVGDCEDSAAVACSLLKTAGFDTALLALYGHVAAGVSLKDFSERDLSEYGEFITTVDVLKHAEGKSVHGDSDIIYYALETVNGQIPAGYLTAGPLQTHNTMSQWGMTGFYPA